MSLNSAINAVISHIQGDSDLVKEIFRGPNSDIKSIPEVVHRLNSAIDRAMARGIREALVMTLNIQPDESIKNTDDFYAGVLAVERAFTDKAETLEQSYHG